ncbi:MAG: OmpA family protein [Flavobacteriales bacterium]|nr:OmpA family protein [Flavobacteriales bacterium]
MLDQPAKREQWPHLALAMFVLSLIVLAAIPANAQFHAERAIDPNESVLEYGSYRLSVAADGQQETCDVVLFGYHSRRPGRWAQLTDTVLRIVPHRRHTLIGNKPGYMFHAETFFPDLLRTPNIQINLRPLDIGQRTDILGIHFLGNQDRMHPKSIGVAEELLQWLNANPSIAIDVIGHVNGADGRKSRTFYRSASIRRAKVLIAWLVNNGISPHRLNARGKGAEALLFPDPIYAWQHEANRRVEIEVVRL